jgi:hypothetical protein
MFYTGPSHVEDSSGKYEVLRLLALLSTKVHYMCPHITTHVSSYYYMCPHTIIYVLSYYYMCPDTTTLGEHNAVIGRHQLGPKKRQGCDEVP